MAFKTKKGTKRRYGKLDEAFSLYIRTRDNFTCQRCGRRRDGGFARPLQGLRVHIAPLIHPSSAGPARIECSHIYSRRHLSTRWDPANAKALCFSCHRWWHENPIDAIEWLKTIRDEKELELLRIRSQQTKKYSEFERELILKDLKEMTAALPEGGVP